MKSRVIFFIDALAQARVFPVIYEGLKSFALDASLPRVAEQMRCCDLRQLGSPARPLHLLAQRWMRNLRPVCARASRAALPLALVPRRLRLSGHRGAPCLGPHAS